MESRDLELERIVLRHLPPTSRFGTRQDFPLLSRCFNLLVIGAYRNLVLDFFWFVLFDAVGAVAIVEPPARVAILSSMPTYSQLANECVFRALSKAFVRGSVASGHVLARARSKCSLRAACAKRPVIE